MAVVGFQNVLGGGVQGGFVSAGDDDVGTQGVQFAGGGQTNACTGAGDEGAAIMKAPAVVSWVHGCVLRGGLV